MRAGGAALAVVLLGAVLVPGLAGAQPGVFVTPSFSIAEVYDDNLFFTPSRREKDLISRFSPGIQAGYQSVPLTLLGRYTFDAEIYPDHPELDDAQVRQEAGIEFRSRPNRTLTLSFDGAFLETQTPGQLNVATGILVGRVRAQRLSAKPGVAYEFDPLTAGAAEYTLTEDELSGGVTILTHVGDLRLDRRITPLDTGSVGYTLREFDFDPGGTTTSHAVTLGWTRQLTPLTSLTLRGGPRFSEGSVDPEVSASIRHRLRLGEVSFTYSRSQTTVIGRAGSVDNEAFIATAVLEPLPSLEVRAAPSLLRTFDADREARVYALDLTAEYKITAWLSLEGAYEFSFQEGGVNAIRDEEISHNIILLRLTVKQPYRIY